MRYGLILLLLGLVACSDEHSKPSSSAPQLAEHLTVLTVSPVVSDSSGYLSLSDALEKSKTLLAEQRSVQIELLSGRYYLDKSILLGPDFSGTQAQPFVIKAAQNADVVLSAGRLLSLDWQAQSQGIYRAKLEGANFDQLFMNSHAQHRARYPNFDPDTAIYNGYAEDAIAAERISHWQNPVGGYVHALHKGRWGGMHYEITGVNQDKSLQLNGGFQNNRASEMHEKYRFVENVYAELDAPGEWYFDDENGFLYFYPPAEIDLDSAKFETSHLNHIIEIVGTSKQPAKHISIEGLTFTHTSHTFMQTNEPLLRSDWMIYRGGALLLDGTEHINVQSNRFHDLGGNGIFASNYNRKVTIASNIISNIGASAISFVGNPSAVRSPSFEYGEFVPLAEIDREPGPKNDEYPSDSIVQDNLIHDIGLVEKQVAGVQISMASNITLSHNSIYRVPRAGINISEGTWGGHIIEYNDVFDTVLETGDHGAFNSWGRDRFWHPDRAVMDELAKQHPGMWELDAQTPTIIRNNRFQCDHGWDIDLDDGSSNYQIYNNVMLSGGLKFREGFKRIATNNIILNNAFHPHVWFENSGDVFSGNILLSGHKPILNDYWGSEVDKNLFVNQADLIAAQALGLDQNSRFGDLDFVDPEQGNYQLAAGSLGLELGFENFPMDQFGVTTEALKTQAETPEIPELFIASSSDHAGKTYEWLGATLKSVETLGEQSALGLPEIAGAMVLKVAADSKIAAAGIRPSDVILAVIDNDYGGGEKIVGVNDLLVSYQSRRWRGELDVVISRNQTQQTLTINVVD